MSLIRYAFIDPALNPHEVLCDIERDGRPYKDSELQIALGILNNHERVITIFAPNGASLLGYVREEGAIMCAYYNYMSGEGTPHGFIHECHPNYPKVKDAMVKEYPDFENVINDIFRYSSVKKSYNALIAMREPEHSRIKDAMNYERPSTVLERISKDDATCEAIMDMLGEYSLTDKERSIILDFVNKVSPRDADGNAHPTDKDIDIAHKLCFNKGWLTGDILDKFHSHRSKDDNKMYDITLKIFETMFMTLSISEKYLLLPSIIDVKYN